MFKNLCKKKHKKRKEKQDQENEASCWQQAAEQQPVRTGSGRTFRPPQKYEGGWDVPATSGSEQHGSGHSNRSAASILGSSDLGSFAPQAGTSSSGGGGLSSRAAGSSLGSSTLGSSTLQGGPSSSSAAQEREIEQVMAAVEHLLPQLSTILHPPPGLKVTHAERDVIPEV